MIKLDDIYQRREYKSLDDIFANDRTGLLDNVKPITKKGNGANKLLEQQFLEIKSFIDTHGREPSCDADDIKEKSLARQLASMRANEDVVQELSALDAQGLLATKQPNLQHNPSASSKNEDASQSANATPTKTLVSNKQPLTIDSIDKITDLGTVSLDANDTDTNSREIQDSTQPDASPIKGTALSINSLDDIFANDELGLFDDIASDILVSDSQKDERASYNQYDDEVIASRFECKDFYKFEPTFERIYHAIQTGAFNKANFSSVNDINIGSVFVLNGMLCYVAQIYKSENRKNERNQYRLRLIFANGTESNMLIRSLATAQYKYENSYQIIITDPEWMDDELAKNFGDYTHLTGVIYVAKLKNTPENLKHYTHLHKIGFSTLTGEMRTRHAINDTAFLQQQVDIIAEWQIYEANARSVESVLHAFFYDQRVKVSTKASDDKLYRANEWFNVPVSEIEKAINLVISGDIKNYYMDASAGRIVPR